MIKDYPQEIYHHLSDETEEGVLPLCDFLMKRFMCHANRLNFFLKFPGNVALEKCQHRI